MQRGGDGGEGTRSACTETRDGPDLGRRECLKLVGTAAVSATGIAAGSDVVRAASPGYGQGGLGEDSYGGDGFGVSTLDATSVGTTSTTLEGTLSDLDGADSADCRFEWRQSGASSWNTTVGQTLTATGSYTRSLSGLSDGTDFEYRALASSSNGDTATGSTVAFTTTEDLPGVSTDAPSSVTESGATLDGRLTDLGNAESVDCRFEWRAVGTSSWNATDTLTRSATGTFSTDLGGLADGSDYEYRAVAGGSDGDTATGSTVAFTTTEDPPAVATDAPSNVTESGATLDGRLTDLGSAASADCRFEWRQSGASSWNATAAQTRSVTGAFSADLGGLSSGADYEYRAVASASDGDTDTGSIDTFTTDTTSTAPEIDSYSVTEAGSPNPHAEITARWSVSDADGDLDAVVVDVIDSSGSSVDSATVSVSGPGASGTEKFKVRHARNETFDVTVTVTDARDNSHSRTRTVTE